MTDPDRDLEVEIDLTYEMLLKAQTPEAQRAAFNQMKALISLRSPRRIENMERDRGLR
jgi:hypothetical protein